MTMLKIIAVSTVSVALVASCAGRTPAPVRTVEASDNLLSCEQIQYEINANNDQIISLSGEEGRKVAQNVAAGVAGLLIWPVWFAMDFQDAAGKEGAALQARNDYLAQMYASKGCASGDGTVITQQTSAPQEAPSSTVAQGSRE